MLCETIKSSEKDNEESFKNVRIMNLGLFAVKKGRLNYLKKKKTDVKVTSDKRR